MNNYPKNKCLAPYLSVVVASRNDDHGGDPLRRTQIFLNCLSWQAARFRLPLEIILVDWNGVSDRPPLSLVLQQADETKQWCQISCITVPPHLHSQLKYSESLPLFQMIAKNVGIRRARGEFVVATNIDIIFSEELMRYLALQKLSARNVYRVDRYDIMQGLADDLALDETLEYAWSNVIRVHRRLGPTSLLKALFPNADAIRECSPDKKAASRVDGVILREANGVIELQSERSATLDDLHTNACGDFTLLSREGWYAIRGYPEFESFSMNIDSVGLAAAHYAGYEEISLLPPCVCFHIEHDVGSGWTPEGQSQLFERLRRSNILSPEWAVLRPLVDEMQREARALEFNGSDWGLAKHRLPQVPLGVGAESASSASFSSVYSSIKPDFDLDALSASAEQESLVNRSRVSAINDNFQLNLLELKRLRELTTPIVQIYWPSPNGAYCEGNSQVCMSSGIAARNLHACFNSEFNWQWPLRIDLVDETAAVRICSILVLELARSRVVATFDGRDRSRISFVNLEPISTRTSSRREKFRSLGVVASNIKPFGSTNTVPFSFFGRTLIAVKSALRFVQKPRPLVIKPSGADPQLYLPPLRSKPSLPIAVLIDIEPVP